MHCDILNLEYISYKMVILWVRVTEAVLFSPKRHLKSRNAAVWFQRDAKTFVKDALEPHVSRWKHALASGPPGLVAVCDWGSLCQWVEFGPTKLGKNWGKSKRTNVIVAHLFTLKSTSLSSGLFKERRVRCVCAFSSCSQQHRETAAKTLLLVWS